MSLLARQAPPPVVGGALAAGLASADGSFDSTGLTNPTILVTLIHC
jgi:hypothetical protein